MNADWSVAVFFLKILNIVENTTKHEQTDYLLERRCVNDLTLALVLWKHTVRLL